MSKSDLLLPKLAIGGSLLFLLFILVMPIPAGVINNEFNMHFFAFLVFGSTAIFGISAFKKWSTLTTFLVGWGVCVLGEVIQIPVPWRSFEVTDMVGNLLGMSLGLLPIPVTKALNNIEIDNKAKRK